MIVNVGKRIKIDFNPYFFERDCETPGAVVVSCPRDGTTMSLPGNQQEAERFITAYRRAISEKIDYVSGKCE